MNLDEAKKHLERHTSGELVGYFDTKDWLYNKIIEEAYDYLKGKNIKLVVGILNSGKLPALKLAELLEVPCSFVEYHKTHDNSGDIPYPVIQTSTVRYPLETFKIVTTDKAYKYTLPFKIDPEFEKEIIESNGSVLVVDDSTSSGHNCVLAAWDIQNNSHLKMENLMYMSLTKSIHNAVNSLRGHNSSEIGYIDTFFGIISDDYSLGPDLHNVLDGFVYFPKISGPSLDTNEYMEKLKRGRELYKNIPIYY